MLYGEGNWLGTASHDSHVSVKELLRLQKAKTGSIVMVMAGHYYGYEKSIKCFAIS